VHEKVDANLPCIIESVLEPILVAPHILAELESNRVSEQTETDHRGKTGTSHVHNLLSTTIMWLNAEAIFTYENHIHFNF